MGVGPTSRLRAQKAHDSTNRRRRRSAEPSQGGRTRPAPREGATNWRGNRHGPGRDLSDPFGHSFSEVSGYGHSGMDRPRSGRGRWRSSSCRANKVAEFSSPSCSVSSVLSSGASWARTCSASATFQGSIYAASRSQSVEPYWCCSCTGSSLAAAPNPRLQRTRPAVDQHATFRLTKRTDTAGEFV